MVLEGIELSLPPSFFFDTPPAVDPLTLHPPTHEQTFRSPVAIDPDIYQWSFSAKVPFTFSITYFAIVTILNAVNRRRGNRPTRIAKHPAFKLLVLWHNFALAVYSAVTCAALVRALYVSVPGWLGPNGLSATLDGLCKIHGPGGYGNAMMYDPRALKWTSKNSAIKLGANRISPNPADEGRIWNEGLAFWGWLFYLSKYYEVVDTIIILLKGKRATTLQKYHHAGALLCMWAGMRYMSPPIWMFVLVNSGIHALMYTFYTLSTLGIRVPGAVKQTLTTMQIMQFLVGASFAAAHLFISYYVPLSTPLTPKSAVTLAAKSAPSAASGWFSTSTSDTSNTGPLPDWLLIAIYRATNVDRLAATVGKKRVQAPTNIGTKAHLTGIQYEKVHCLDTNGEAFAIWLNVFYLAPLTLLFLRFFWKSYIIGRPKKTKQEPQSPRRLSVSAVDAARETSQSFEDYGTEFEKSIDWGAEEVMEKTSDGPLSHGTVEELQKELRKAYEEIVESKRVEGGEEQTIEEVAVALERATSDTVDVADTEPFVIKLPEANGVSRQSSKSSSKSKKGIPQQQGEFSEQDWFGRRVIPPSVLREINPNMDPEPQQEEQEQQEEETTTSTSTAQLGSWTDIKEEETSHSSVIIEETITSTSTEEIMEEEYSSRQTDEEASEEHSAVTYADVTKNSKPSTTDSASEDSKKTEDDNDDLD